MHQKNVYKYKFHYKCNCRSTINIESKISKFICAWVEESEKKGDEQSSDERTSFRLYELMAVGLKICKSKFLKS